MLYQISNQELSQPRFPIKTFTHSTYGEVPLCQTWQLNENSYDFAFPSLRDGKGICCYGYHLSGIQSDPLLSSAPSIAGTRSGSNWTFNDFGSTRDCLAIGLAPYNNKYYVGIVLPLVSRNKITGSLYDSYDDYISVKWISCYNNLSTKYGQSFTDGDTNMFMTFKTGKPGDIHTAYWAIVGVKNATPEPFLDTSPSYHGSGNYDATWKLCFETSDNPPNFMMRLRDENNVWRWYSSGGIPTTGELGTKVRTLFTNDEGYTFYILSYYSRSDFSAACTQNDGGIGFPNSFILNCGTSSSFSMIIPQYGYTISNSYISPLSIA